ncbi:hypothetical protein MMG00_02250 [Ignatzschineria rhizosphaerae]|uniref:Sel1 repeat family protein n=1 Tax=Ignatzschineria rhizosphaerae TaxID=2923279 RepID=A0ABY3X1E6_9GAMM|nr:hypothetical protein [Ignatzschineria rhizosphaerae]UNM96699.1 hypothetical protein MMG00_02250 [Ignatzschineria rhizosphaerae]
MKKLPLSLLLSSILLCGNFSFAAMIDGYRALGKGDHQDAYHLFLKESKNNAKANFALAMMSYEGLGTSKDLVETQKRLEKAIDAGSVEAIYNLGVLRLDEELPTNKGDLSWLSLLLQAGEQNLAQASIRLGIELMSSEGASSELFTEEIIKTINQQLETAFQKGNGFAGFVLGAYWVEAEKFGVAESNYLKAIDYLEKSYEYGFLPAAMGLASLYAEGGHGLIADQEKAEKYEQFVFENMHILGGLEDYLPGLLTVDSAMTPKEQKQMLGQLEKDAQKNSVPAIVQLIRHYELGTLGVAKNPAKVSQYIEQLETINSGESLFALGRAFFKAGDESQALHYMELAAERDHIPAVIWLSDPLHHGWNPDDYLIEQYVLQGANLGDPHSILALIERLKAERSNRGWWNEDARPVLLIEQEIYEWAERLQKVAPQMASTQILFSNIYQLGMGIEENPQKAYEYMLAAYESVPNNEEVLLTLAIMNLEGYGTEKNTDAAAHYYLKVNSFYQSLTAIEGLLRLNQETIGFKGSRELQSQILEVELDEYANQNQYFTILDQLLDELEILLTKSYQETTYGYLLADRYFSQYFHLQEKIEEQQKSGLEINPDWVEERAKIVDRAMGYYQSAYDNSEQAKLHYVEALIFLSQKSEGNKIQADHYVEEALRALMHIDSLSTPREQLPENHPRFLSQKEQVRAIKKAIELLNHSEDFQVWFGDRVLVNNPAAVELLTKLIDGEDRDASHFALFYLGKKAVKEQQATGYDQIIKAAEQAYLPAIRYLGKAYAQQEELLIAHLGGTSHDAINWYEKGIALKDEDSIYELAELYYENQLGFNLSAGESDLKAIALYEQLQDPDYRFAKYHLNEAKERAEAYQAIQKGLQDKDPEAFYQQSEIYRYGKYGETQNLQKAEEYLIKAADMGYLRAMRAYYDQYRDDKTIEGETLTRFNRYHIGYVHGAKGDWETQRLADRYLIGDRITESRQKAREYYEFALENDPSSSASYDLGYMNRFDQNLPLAERGNAEAMLIIGRGYEGGRGVKEDLEKSYYWLEKAANAGNSDAAFYFGVLAQKGLFADNGDIIIAPNWEIALKWYEKASPRFKNAISGRVKEYETIHQPAENGDANAMVKLGDLYEKRYRSKAHPYDLKMAKSWYDKALAAGNLSAHFGLMKLLPEEKQGSYLQDLINSTGDLAFKMQLSKEIAAQSSATLTLENLQLAVDNLIAIIEDKTIDTKLRSNVIEQLLALYHQRYTLTNGERIQAPGFEKSYQLALSYSTEIPAVKRLVADALYEQGDLDGAMQLWQEGADDGDHFAVLRIYRQLMPRGYDTVTLAELEKLDALTAQYLSLAPAFPVGPSDYEEFFEIYDAEGVLDNDARSEMSALLASLWQQNGADFMADPVRAKRWYQQALDFKVTNSNAENLRSIVASQLFQNPQNLTYLAELYLYGSINDNIDRSMPMFDRLTSLQKKVLMQQAISYQDERDYGRHKWVMITQQKESDAGSATAALILGDHYREGQYTRQNLEKAIEYYELAGSRGNATAYNRLGYMFRKNEDGIEPDYPRALAYYEKGTALNDSNTAHLAGDMLYFGEGGIDKDYAKAAKYYGLTDVKQGNHHALAKFKQAEIIYQGLIKEPTLEDYQKAFDLLLLSMEYGEKRALDAVAKWDFTMLHQQKQSSQKED